MGWGVYIYKPCERGNTFARATWCVWRRTRPPSPHQHLRPRNTAAFMTFTAPLPMFTVVTARGVRSTANAATLAESELSVPPRAGQHDRVGAVGPRNGNARGAHGRKTWHLGGNGRVGPMAKTSMTRRCVVRECSFMPLEQD